jgi:hypothetical protein
VVRFVEGRFGGATDISTQPETSPNCAEAGTLAFVSGGAAALTLALRGGLN